MLKYNLPFLIIYILSLASSDPLPSLSFDYPYIKDEIYEGPVDMMAPKTPHEKTVQKAPTKPPEGPVEEWPPYDFSKFETLLDSYKENPAGEHNRIKRRAKRRRGRVDRRRGRQRATTTQSDPEIKNATTTEVPIARRGNRDDPEPRRDREDWETHQVPKKRKSKSKGKKQEKPNYETYEAPLRDWESNYVEMPKDLYQAHLRPGVIFRIHMSEAILKMQYRNYGEDKDESVIEADVEYLRLTRKVINDEITKFEDLRWLVGWFNNRSELIQEHMCNTRYYAVGVPPTMFSHPEEYMKRLCLFDSVYIDHIPYAVGEDGSLMAAVAPPVLHCDAATCTSVPFIDSVMFDERLARTSVRTVTRCQASCRAHCRNDPDCLKRCSDRCLRSD